MGWIDASYIGSNGKKVPKYVLKSASGEITVFCRGMDGGEEGMWSLSFVPYGWDGDMSACLSARLNAGGDSSAADVQAEALAVLEKHIEDGIEKARQEVDRLELMRNVFLGMPGGTIMNRR